MSGKNLYENNSGCYDPVAGDVIGRVDAERKRTKRRAKRINKISRALHDVCDIAGFRFKGKIVIIDKSTGEEFYI